MNLQQLKYFTMLAEVGHFGRAAEKLYITQPALSNSIKGLERELGADLFERTGHKVILTPYGSRFITHIIKALHEIDRAVNLSPSPRLDQPTIKIATVASIQQTFLPSLLLDYAEETRRRGKPQPRGFDIVEARTTFDCLRLISEGKLDLAFCGNLTASGLAWIPVLAQNLVAAVSPLHPLAQRTSVSLKELSDYPIISYRSSSMIHEPVKSVVKALQLHFHQAFNDELAAAPCIAANPPCVALLLDTAEGDLRKRISYIPIEEFREPFHLVGLTYKRSSLENDDVARFTEYIEARFAPLTSITPVESMLPSAGIFTGGSTN